MKIVCRKCGKLREKYCGEYCQICYRKLLSEYSFYEYKPDVDKNKLNKTCRRVCELLIEEGVNRLEIHKILGINKAYVQQIVNKYTNRVNANGDIRPF